MQRAYLYRVSPGLVLAGAVCTCSPVDPTSTTTTEDTTVAGGTADAGSGADGSASDGYTGSGDNDGTVPPIDGGTTSPPNDGGTNGSGDTPPPVDDCGNEIRNGNDIVSGPAATEPPIDNDTVFRSLVVDPRNPDVVFCGSERNAFLKSMDGGATWSRLRTGLRHSAVNENYPGIWNVAFSPVDGGTLLAATTDSAGPVTGDAPSAIAGIYKTTDGGETWLRSNCGLSNSKIGFVLFSPTDGNVALAAVQGEAASFAQSAGVFFGGGIYRSSDRGDNWSLTAMPVGADEKNRYWIIRAAGNPTEYITFGFKFENPSINAGFLRSADEGQTWTAFAAELRNRTVTHFDVSADGQIIYALPQSSFLFERSVDGGQTWQKLSDVSPGPQGPIAICTTDSQTVLFTSNADLRRTTDGMQTDVVVQTAAAQFEWIVFAPSDNDVVYAATQGYDVYKSTDKGATFDLVANLRDEINSVP